MAKASKQDKTTMQNYDVLTLKKKIDNLEKSLGETKQKTMFREEAGKIRKFIEEKKATYPILNNFKDKDEVISRVINFDKELQQTQGNVPFDRVLELVEGDYRDLKSQFDKVKLEEGENIDLSSVEDSNEKESEGSKIFDVFPTTGETVKKESEKSATSDLNNAEVLNESFKKYGLID